MGCCGAAKERAQVVKRLERRQRLPDTGCLGRTPEGRYDAFVSYAHAKDQVLGEALEQDLRRFARPWNRKWSVRVYRDTSNLAVSPNLWASVERALLSSGHLLLLATPEAARSKWVAREVESFLNHQGPEKLLFILTAGEIGWDEQRGDFDWSITTALPPVLMGRVPCEPKYLDLRWASSLTKSERRKPAWKDAVAELSSVLQGRPKDELVGEDVRQRHRERAIIGAAIVALIATPLFTIGYSTRVTRTVYSEASDRVTRTERRTQEQVEALFEAQTALRSGDVTQALEIYRREYLGSEAIEREFDRVLEQVLRDDPGFEFPAWKSPTTAWRRRDYYPLKPPLTARVENIFWELDWRMQGASPGLALLLGKAPRQAPPGSVLVQAGDGPTFLYPKPPPRGGAPTRVAPNRPPGEAAIEPSPTFRYLERLVARGPGPEINFGSIFGPWKAVHGGLMDKQGFRESEEPAPCLASVSRGAVYFKTRGKRYLLSRATPHVLYAESHVSYAGHESIEPGALFWGEAGDLVHVSLCSYTVEAPRGTSEYKELVEPRNCLFAVSICRRDEPSQSR